MGVSPKILAFAGSTRTDSYNKKLVKIAMQGAQDQGAEVSFIDLRDFPLPLFDEDLEKKDGLPANVLKLKKLFLEHQGLMISSPEYNSSITAVLKNTIDWVSRTSVGETALACFNNKTAVLMSASPGALGGLRGLVHLRAILSNINVLVLPAQVAIPKAYEAFDEKGSLKDQKLSETVKQLGSNLAKTLVKLNS